MFKIKNAKNFNEDVERVRRAHRNDLENILPLMIITLFYILTSPSPFIAINLIRIAAISRCIHTFAYAIISLQPARLISYLICAAITVYMSFATIFYFF